MKVYLMLLFSFILIISYSSCRKNDAVVPDQVPTFIQNAKKYFENEITVNDESRDINLNLRNPSRARQTARQQLDRKPIWDKAYLAHFSFGLGIVVPVKYANPAIINSNFGGKKLYNLNDLTKLLIYQDKAKQYHYEMITSFPDSNYNNQYNELFTGLLFIEDWWGKTTKRYKYEINGGIRKYDTEESDKYLYSLSNGYSDTKNSDNESESSRVITICYEVSGYNYSSVGSDSGYYWTEPAGCQTYYLLEGDVYPGYGGSSGTPGAPTSGDYGTVPIGTANNGTGYPINPVKNMAVLNGNNIISNIKDYNKCFINIPGSDHSYHVRLCVSQPVPGTRSPWGFEDPNGSTTNASPVFVGHTFLVLTETTPTRTITRNVGFYPKSNASPFSPTDQGQLNNDEVHEYDISLEVTMTSGEFFTMLDFIEQGNSTGYMYDLNSNNCSTFALNAFSRIGINLPRTQGKWASGGGLNPGDLGEDIRSMTLSSNMTRTGIYGSHPNSGTCN